MSKKLAVAEKSVEMPAVDNKQKATSLIDAAFKKAFHPEEFQPKFICPVCGEEYKVVLANSVGRRYVHEFYLNESKKPVNTKFCDKKYEKVAEAKEAAPSKTIKEMAEESLARIAHERVVKESQDRLTKLFKHAVDKKYVHIHNKEGFAYLGKATAEAEANGLVVLTVETAVNTDMMGKVILADALELCQAGEFVIFQTAPFMASEVA